jgi:hypothetical protein
MHVSGTPLLTQEGRDCLKREVWWVLEHPGNWTLGLCAYVRAWQAHPSCISWQKRAGAHHHDCFI